MLDFLRELFPYFSPILAAFAGWAFGRRKQVADAETSELNNVEKGLGIYRGIIDDLLKGQADLRRDLDLLSEENVKLKERQVTFINENKGLKSQNDNLRKRVSHLEKEIADFKNQQHD